MPRLAWGQRATPGAAGVTFQPNPLAPPPASPGRPRRQPGPPAAPNPSGAENTQKSPFFSAWFFFFHHGASAEAQPALFFPTPHPPRFSQIPFFFFLRVFPPPLPNHHLAILPGTRGRWRGRGRALEKPIRPFFFWGVFTQNRPPPPKIASTPPPPPSDMRGELGARWQSINQNFPHT